VALWRRVAHAIRLALQHETEPRFARGAFEGSLPRIAPIGSLAVVRAAGRRNGCAAILEIFPAALVSLAAEPLQHLKLNYSRKGRARRPRRAAAHRDGLPCPTLYRGYNLRKVIATNGAKRTNAARRGFAFSALFVATD
jgi:hypothetical protein